MLSAVLAAADPVVQACGPDRDPWLCRWVAQWTDSKTAGDVGEHLSPWVTVILIALAAVIANRLLRRLVRREVRQWEHGGHLRWLRGRRVVRLLESSGPIPDIRRHQRAETIASGLASLATIIVWSIAIVAMLSTFGVHTATVLTSAGLIGVALAFGAQNLLRDLIAGAFIIVEDQIGVGDVVDVGVAGGTVERVSLRTTRLRDVEGVVWHVPNGEIRRVGNKSQQWSRAVLDIPVAYGADIDEAQRVILRAALAMAAEDEWAARVLSPPEVWGVETFTLDTVSIRLVAKTAPAEQWRVARELRARVKLALDAVGIESRPATPPPDSAGDGSDDAAG